MIPHWSNKEIFILVRNIGNNEIKKWRTSLPNSNKILTQVVFLEGYICLTEMEKKNPKENTITEKIYFLSIEDEQITSSKEKESPDECDRCYYDSSMMIEKFYDSEQGVVTLR